MKKNIKLIVCGVVFVLIVTFGLCSGLVALIAVGVVVSLVFVKKNKKQ